MQTDPNLPFSQSIHNAQSPSGKGYYFQNKYGEQINQMHRYKDYLNANPQIKEVVVKANTQELADYYQKEVINRLAAAGKDMSKFRVVYEP